MAHKEGRGLNDTAVGVLLLFGVLLWTQWAAVRMLDMVASTRNTDSETTDA